MRVARDVLHVEAEEHHPPCSRALAPRALEGRRLFLTGHAPGGPEVEHDGCPAQIAQRHGPPAEHPPELRLQRRVERPRLQHVQAERRRDRRQSLAQRVVDRRIRALRRHAVDEHSDQQQRDARHKSAEHPADRTGARALGLHRGLAHAPGLVGASTGAALLNWLYWVSTKFPEVISRVSSTRPVASSTCKVHHAGAPGSINTSVAIVAP